MKFILVIKHLLMLAIGLGPLDPIILFSDTLTLYVSLQLTGTDSEQEPEDTIEQSLLIQTV